MTMTKLRLFFLDLFEKYQGFRRMIVLYVCWLTAYLSIESLSLIALAITNNANLIDLSASFVAVYGPLGAVMAFVSKLYWVSRNKDIN